MDFVPQFEGAAGPTLRHLRMAFFSFREIPFQMLETGMLHEFLGAETFHASSGRGDDHTVGEAKNRRTVAVGNGSVRGGGELRMTYSQIQARDQV